MKFTKKSDAVLRYYAKGVLSIFRHHDLVARYGGEKFAVLLPNTGQADVLRAREKVHRRLADFSAQLNEEGVLLPTFSAGVAEYGSGEITHSFIERVDAALYTAKHNGGDRVEVHSGGGFAEIQGRV
ncbi:MAG TPA: GGDEF domain-containing protein [Gammaproteobacteria bacterium]|nr:GGDEF domain-containing protein [Gammaproteobacteria bacterium]